MTKKTLGIFAILLLLAAPSMSFAEESKTTDSNCWTNDVLTVLGIDSHGEDTVTTGSGTDSHDKDAVTTDFDTDSYDEDGFFL